MAALVCRWLGEGLAACPRRPSQDTGTALPLPLVQAPRPGLGVASALLRVLELLYALTLLTHDDLVKKKVPES